MFRKGILEFGYVSRIKEVVREFPRFRDLPDNLRLTQAEYVFAAKAPGWGRLPLATQAGQHGLKNRFLSSLCYSRLSGGYGEGL
jgi:hypothetical protein